MGGGGGTDTQKTAHHSKKEAYTPQRQQIAAISDAYTQKTAYYEKKTRPLRSGGLQGRHNRNGYPRQCTLRSAGSYTQCPWRQIAAATAGRGCVLLTELYFVYATPMAAWTPPLRCGAMLLLQDGFLYTKPPGGSEGPQPLRLQSAGPAMPVRGEFLRRAACRPRAKIHTSQFLRPKKSADFLAKTASLSHNHRNYRVCPKYALQRNKPKKPIEMNFQFISIERRQPLTIPPGFKRGMHRPARRGRGGHAGVRRRVRRGLGFGLVLVLLRSFRVGGVVFLADQGRGLERL